MINLTLERDAYFSVFKDGAAVANRDRFRRGLDGFTIRRDALTTMVWICNGASAAAYRIGDGGEPFAIVFDRFPGLKPCRGCSSVIIDLDIEAGKITFSDPVAGASETILEAKGAGGCPDLLKDGPRYTVEVTYSVERLMELLKACPTEQITIRINANNPERGVTTAVSVGDEWYNALIMPYRKQ